MKARTPEEFVKEIQRGVDHGPTPFELLWLSKDKRFAIFKKRGHACWAGRGSRGYAPTAHYLMDLAAAPDNRLLYSTATRVRIEGRITKAVLDQMKKVGDAGGPKSKGEK